MLDVYVINLATSTERWETTSNRLTELGISYERFEAVDGRKEPHPLFTRYDDKLREKYRRKGLSGAELGCYSSHYLLWKHCIAINKPIVVMEDDVIVGSSLPEALKIADEQIENLQYLRLAGTILRHKPFKKIRKMGSFDLVDHIKGPSGALCYVIAPMAAKKLIAHAETWFIAVDDYMDHYWWHGVDCYSLMPFPITFGDNLSDIPRLPKKKWPLWKKLRKEFYGLIERIKMIRYRVKNQSL
jgi:glycosyl transferase family 25